jgi:rod shape-determining protein MreD
MAEPLGISPARILASLLPALLALVCVALVNLPVSFTGGLLPPPLIALAPIYFWVLIRPDLMPPIAVLLIGLVEDLLSGGPPGTWAVGFLAAYWVADQQREFFSGLGGMAGVLGFAAAMFLGAAAAWLLISVVYARWEPVAPLLLESVVTVLFYPVIALPLAWMHQNVVGAFRGDD